MIEDNVGTSELASVRREGMRSSARAGVSGAPGLVHSDMRGDFEAMAPLTAGCLGHWFRDNGRSRRRCGPGRIAPPKAS